MLRMPDVLKKTALSRSQIYRLIKQDEFPRQVRLGERAAGWVEEEVAGWLRERIERSRTHAASRSLTPRVKKLVTLRIFRTGGYRPKAAVGVGSFWGRDSD
jgi:prophage regulatory protein